MATVRNLDWPSGPGMSPRKMKKEFIRQLNRLQVTAVDRFRQESGVGL
jgi:hypothetical protein